MIDTHCHIIPMCDDGPEHWNQSLDMAREAVRQGITGIIATPHHGKGSYYNNPDKIAALVKQFNGLLVNESIPLTVWAGQEYHLSANYKEQSGIFNNVQPLADSKYVLVELPSKETPKYLNDFIRFLKSNELIPIIAHPERHHPFIREPGRLYELIGLGVLFQLTAPSLVGHYGTEVQQAAWMMARNRWIHILASDAHDLNKRAFRLREAFWLLEAGLQRETVDYLRFNAEQLVQGEVLETGEPIIPFQHKSKRKIPFWNPHRL
ncbi:tyrosine-protein phosphatase [Cohnella silvisoli]|uniref:Tyrosine-protein phosphatase n=1 Tax=Cohnella silvisoli TaxID=2873699 RepID=A0ABV1KVV9_9BACL|nr:CpsB/CapC family capsule biosynthesis tyrosine phosphatase [Cohnella silvisoli]MCD9023648.1 hypothetical protein [Cohnella silvisoli]